MQPARGSQEPLAEVLSEPPRHRLGATIQDSYRIDALIAQGGMGTIFRAVDLSSNETVAVKILRDDLGLDGAKVFAREAALLAKLRHRNIVAMLHHGRTADGSPFIVMPFLEGHPLSREKGTAMPPIRAAKIIADTLRALVHAHDKGVIHRDLKPENIFLTRDEAGAETVKLLDFGIARQASRETEDASVTLSGLMSGTPAYMAPEQIFSTNSDERTDLYAVGVILYEMLQGQPMCDSDDPAMILQHKLTTESPTLPAEAGGLGPIFSRLTAKEPDDRYPNAQSALTDVAEYLLGVGASPSQSTTTSARSADSTSANLSNATGRKPGSGRSPWLLGGLGVLALGSLLAIVALSGGRSDAADATPASTAAPVPTAQAPSSDGPPRPPPPTSSPAVTGPSDEDADRAPEWLPQLNEANAPLPYGTRHWRLDQIAKTRFADRVNWQLQTWLDLEQAQDSPTPCTTFRDALMLVESRNPRAAADVLARASVPDDEHAPDGDVCDDLEDELDRVRVAAGLRPKKSSSSRRRASSRRQRKPTSPTTGTTPVASPEAPSTPAASPETSPPRAVTETPAAVAAPPPPEPEPSSRKSVFLKPKERGPGGSLLQARPD